ncbi:hypothetical protein [Algoriella sp.]|uniref:hypothetical protein n=1 Tax=Algoriella sp. TaxID=1872434 RepID=UPI002FCAB83A
MKNVLIPLLAFVLASTNDQKHRRDKYDDVVGYSLFIKQGLSPGMFAPCDDEGNILNHPYPIKQNDPKDYSLKVYDKSELNQYNKSKENVLFDGWKVTIADTENGDVIYDFEYKDIEFSYNKTEDVFMDSHGEWLAFSTIEDLALLADVMSTEVLLTNSAMNLIKS